MDDFQCCPVGGSGATGTPSQGFTGCLAVFYLLRGRSSVRPEFQTQKRVQIRESLFSDTLGCWPQRTLYKNEFQGEGGSYNARPYQILDSFKCKTAGMGYWSEWSNWSDCSKKGSTNCPVDELDVEAVPRSLILSNVQMEFPKALEERLENASMQKLETLDATILPRLK